MVESLNGEHLNTFVMVLRGNLYTNILYKAPYYISLNCIKATHEINHRQLFVGNSFNEYLLQHKLAIIKPKVLIIVLDLYIIQLIP